MFTRILNGMLMEGAGDDGAAGGGGGADAGAGAGAAGSDGAGAAGATGAGAGGQGEGTGQPKISDKEHQLLQEVMSKKAKIKELESTLTTVQGQLKQFEGIDVTKVRELLNKQSEDEQKRLEAAGEFDKVKQQMREAHQSEVQTLQQQIEALSSEIKGRDSVIDELSIGHAFTNSGFIREKLVLPPSKARTVFGQHFERDAQGRIVAYDKPKGAQGRAPFVNADGDPVSFDEAIAKLVERDPDKDLILRAAIKAGAGSNTSTVTSGAAGQGEQLEGKSRIAKALQDGALKKQPGLKLMK